MCFSTLVNNNNKKRKKKKEKNQFSVRDRNLVNALRPWK